MATKEQKTANPQSPEEEEEKKVYEVPYTINLKVPIEWGEEKRETLVISRRLKAGDFKGMRATDLRYDDMIKLISKVSTESVKFIEELDGADFSFASKVVESFL